MTPPPSDESGRHDPACQGTSCQDPGCPELRRAVDAALGSDYDRAFTMLDAIRTEDRDGCSCLRCLTRMSTLHLALGCELRQLDQQNEHQQHDDGP